MTVYPEMNNKIVELLRMGDTPVELYAAQRIEELELKNMELLDRVLEIIDEKHDDFRDGSFRDNSITYAQAWKRSNEAIREAVEGLRGEEQG